MASLVSVYVRHHGAEKDLVICTDDGKSVKVDIEEADGLLKDLQDLKNGGIF